MRIVCLLLLLTATTSALAQTTDFDRSRLNTAAFYNYSELGDVTIQVHMWGAVRFPGLYEIPQATKFSELLSLAGGPQFGERDKRTSRTMTVRVMRDVGGRRVLVYDATMKNNIVITDEDPILMEGDVIAVESVIRQGIQWRDLFPIVAAVASTAIAVDRLLRPAN